MEYKYEDPIENILKSHIKRGDFTLSSGKKTDFYIDCRPLLLSRYVYDRSLYYKFLQAKNDIIAQKGISNTLYYCGVPTAGIYLASLFALKDCIDLIHIRGDIKKYGNNEKFIELPIDEPIIYDYTILFDDVLTTGNSIEKSIKMLMLNGICVGGAIVLVDREEGGKEYLEEKYKIPVVPLYSKSNLLG